MNSVIQCGKYKLDFTNKTLIMGIVNVTPDSFSDGGQYNSISGAVEHAERLVAEGADILDIGGESTRPGHEPVSVQEELDRVIPVIKALSKRVSVPISIDTYKAEVAKRAIEAGATIINDIWGAKAEPEIAKVAKEFQVPIILMHNRPNRDYLNFMEDAIKDLQDSIEMALSAGVPKGQIILDPGIGFAKDFAENIEMMQNLDRLVELGFPVLLATSRKRMIGHILDLPVDERMEGTGASVCYGIQKGCQLVRVHDVKEIKRMVDVMDVLCGKRKMDG
ncbi:dihydropteroate synthase [Bacillus carboniphilus]|uniref:Dihydropteroate synthase n=1 Tax=Bacillus carboniphilus TaxID=86663 RepID=A0ABN0VYN7_9BACI